MSHDQNDGRLERTDDPLIGQAEQAQAEAPALDDRTANLFDVRYAIAGLFLLYGAILTVLGILASDAEIEKAAGLNSNLWTGLALLLVGSLFLIWARVRPVLAEVANAGGDASPEVGSSAAR